MVKIDELSLERKNSLTEYAKYLKKQYLFANENELANHLILLYNYSNSEETDALRKLI